MNCANHQDRENTAFCQNCGKPICQECTRVIGTAVYCEPCLAARLSGAGAPPPAGGGTYTYTGGEGGLNYTVSGSIPAPGEPNPGLAALLGLIPGVGAMYNGQYAKGVVHLIVFAILVSLANENGIFGLFIAGWVCYQVIEAHHTAKARRDGTPLPNPFGLNDLSERLGFGKSWPSPGAAAPHAAAPDATQATGSSYNSPPPNYPPPPSAGWSAPWDSYAVPPVPPYAAGYPGTPGYPGNPLDPNLAPVRNRFPAGALWLIGLGCLFLIGNSGLFHTFPIHRLVPFFLIGLGVWLFVRRMTDTGTGIGDDGTPGYQFRLFRALRGSVWVTLIGVLFLLDSFGIVSWAHSWPIIIIVAGLMLVFQRISYSSVMATPYPYPAPPTPPPPSPPPPGTSIVPSNHDQEGR
jgi:B-box zinc finger/Domain of unknown function (DUF5668)